MFKFSLLLVLVSLTLTTLYAAVMRETSRYPNELTGFRFYSVSKWRPLKPLVSTMSDVRRVLGNPKVADDVSQFTRPYPGDSKAKSPVFTYDMNSEWEILIYFVKYSSCDCPRLRKTGGDLLYSVELIPKNRIKIAATRFSTAFRKEHITAADAAWDEYSDDRGLSYHVYTTREIYGARRPGDLNRIVYGPSQEEISKREGEP